MLTIIGTLPLSEGMLFCPFVSFNLITLCRIWHPYLSFPHFYEKLFFPEFLEEGVQYSFSQCTETPLPLFTCSEISWLCPPLLFLLGTSLPPFSLMSLSCSAFILCLEISSLYASALIWKGALVDQLLEFKYVRPTMTPGIHPLCDWAKPFSVLTAHIFCAFPVLFPIEAAAMHVWCPRVVCPHLFVFGVFGDSLTQFYLKCCSCVFGFAI